MTLAAGYLSAQQLRKAASLRAQIDALEGKLASILGAVATASSGRPAKGAGRGTDGAAKKARKPRRKLSAAARARIAAATKARWAKAKKAGRTKL